MLTLRVIGALMSPFCWTIELLLRIKNVKIAILIACRVVQLQSLSALSMLTKLLAKPSPKFGAKIPFAEVSPVFFDNTLIILNKRKFG
jgi:hypothetical protein